MVKKIGKTTVHANLFWMWISIFVRQQNVDVWCAKEFKTTFSVINNHRGITSGSTSAGPGSVFQPWRHSVRCRWRDIAERGCNCGKKPDSGGWSVCRSVSRSVGRSVGRSVCRSVCRSVSRPVSRSVSRSVSWSVDWYVGQSTQWYIFVFEFNSLMLYPQLKMPLFMFALRDIVFLGTSVRRCPKLSLPSLLEHARIPFQRIKNSALPSQTFIADISKTTADQIHFYIITLISIEAMCTFPLHTQ